MILKQQVGVEQQVVEVEGVRRLQALLETRVNARGDLAYRVGYLGGENARNEQLVFRLRDTGAQRFFRPALWVQVELRHDIPDKLLGVAVVVDGEISREAKHFGIRAENTDAHAVERGHPHSFRSGAYKPCETLAHFGRRLVRERDCKDLPRTDPAIFDEVRDTVREHARFAGACARKHQKRPLRAQHRLTLRSVQSVQVNAHANLRFLRRLTLGREPARNAGSNCTPVGLPRPQAITTP